MQRVGAAFDAQSVPAQCRKMSAARDEVDVGAAFRQQAAEEAADAAGTDHCDAHSRTDLLTMRCAAYHALRGRAQV